MSAIGAKAENICSRRVFRLLTLKRTRLASHLAVAKKPTSSLYRALTWTDTTSLPLKPQIDPACKQRSGARPIEVEVDVLHNLAKLFGHLKIREEIA